MRQYVFINDDYELVELPVISSSKIHNHKLLPNKLPKPIIANLGGKLNLILDTQYPVISEVCDSLGWKI